MEDQLQLQEIRKAQRDLTDAFSFRRSINLNEDGEPFAQQEEKSTMASSITDDADGSQVTKKKIRRRRKVVKKTEDPDANDISGVVEDLVMPDTTTNDNAENNISAKTEATENLDTSPVGWFEDPQSETQPDPEQQQQQKQQEASRFQQQLSSQWNDTILQNDDKLSPLSNIMERLAILEEERTATEKRLEEEFRERMSIIEEERAVRTEMEEEFYSKKRKLLEEAALEVQTNVFMDSNTNGKNEKNASGDNSSTKTAEATTANLSKNANESK